jgi:hypothetical protein
VSLLFKMVTKIKAYIVILGVTGLSDLPALVGIFLRGGALPRVVLKQSIVYDSTEEKPPS